MERKRRRGRRTRSKSATLEEQVRTSDLATYADTDSETGDPPVRGLVRLGRDGRPLPPVAGDAVPAGSDAAAVAAHELALAMRQVYPQLRACLERFVDDLLQLYTEPVREKASVRDLVERERAAARAAGWEYDTPAREVFAEWARLLDAVIALEVLVTAKTSGYPPPPRRRGRKHDPALTLAARLAAERQRRRRPGASDRVIAEAVAEDLRAAGVPLGHLDNPAEALRKRIARRGGVGHK